MNTKIALGIVVTGVVIVAISFYLVRPLSVTEQASIASSTTLVSHPQKTSGNPAQPTVTVGTPTATGVKPVTAFDSSSLASTSSYPVITGTANVPSIGVIIKDNKGVGIVGTSNISVVNGHWSYADSVSLRPGNYTVVLYVGKTVTAAGGLTVHY